MIRIIPGFNNVQMDAQVNLTALRFMLQDEIAELEEDSYYLMLQAVTTTDPLLADRYEEQAKRNQDLITVAMNKLQAID